MQLQIIDENNLPPSEKRFHHICVTNGLNQFNYIKNSRGSTLDWILSNSIISNVQHVPAHLSLDNDTNYHKSISFEIIYHTPPGKHEENVNQYDYSTTKLNHTKWALVDEIFPQITLQDGAYYYTHDESKILNKLEAFSERLKSIQNKFTKFKKRNNKSQDQGHPWTRDRRYRTLINTRKFIKKTCTLDPSPQNIAKLRTAHINCFALYNKLKAKYYANLVLNLGTNSTEFY